MKKIIFFVFLAFSASIQATEQVSSQFIVKSDEKKLSKQSANSLKELLGEITRDTFKRSIALNKQLGAFHVALGSKKNVSILHQELGAWQVEIACLQLHCSEVLEKLIENQKPFKKATKQELQAAYTSMQEAYDLLGTLATLVKNEQKNLEKDGHDFVSKAVLSVQSSVAKTKNMQISFNTHSCLKLV